MTLQQFRDKYIGKKVDFDGFYGGQCVDLYRQYVKDVLGYPQSPGVGGAAEIWDSASPEYYDFIKNTPTGVPQPGDIVIWNRRAGGGFGHVAIFLRGDINRFTSLDQNWPTLDKVTETEHNYTNVIGWLRPKKGSDMQIDEATFNKLVANSTKWDGVHKYLELSGDPATTPLEQATNSIGGLKSRATDLQNQLAKAQAEVKNREEQVARLKDEINKNDLLRKELVTKLSSTEKIVNEYEGRIGTLKEQVDGLAKEKGEFNTKLALLEAENANLKKNISSNLSLRELLKMVIDRVIPFNL